MKEKYWSPYLAGGISGVALVISVWLGGKFFGASTSFVRIAELIEKMFVSEHVANLAYFQSKVPKVEWQVMFVVGIVIGSFLAAHLSKTFKVVWVPSMWEQRFGGGRIKRAIFAFVGGVLSMIGAR